MVTKKKIKFTFKTTRPTGSYAWIHKPYHDVLLNKNKVGSIEHEKPNTIRLMIMKTDIMEDGNPNCPWKWISLKKESESLDDAKIFLNKSIDIILTKYKIRTYENIKNNEK
jgi:hypothetical protein